jgi:hypothetical protein
LSDAVDQILNGMKIQSDVNQTAGQIMESLREATTKLAEQSHQELNKEDNNSQPKQ